MRQQRGGTFLGFVLGMVIGLAAALAVAVYVTKVPVPFVSKALSRDPDQDANEQQKNKGWNPNAPLYGKNPAKPTSVAEQVVNAASETAEVAPKPSVSTGSYTHLDVYKRQAVKFDNYYLESSLYTSGRVDAAVKLLQDAGKTYQQDGALWLRSTDYGDDKDRVMRKQDGSYTYFVPDLAYHIAKWERGFEKVINIQGTDHHGTIARVRAGLQAANVGIPQGFPDYVLHTMVRVVRGGEEVKISKRVGSYVTLRDLIEWTSKDAVRFFLLSRKPDTEYTFDVDLAVAQNNDNPVYLSLIHI